MDNELPGFGILVTVMPEAVLAARFELGAVDSGRASEERVVEARAAALNGATVLAAGFRSVDAAGETLPSAVGRTFLLDRSTEPDDW